MLTVTVCLCFVALCCHAGVLLQRVCAAVADQVDEPFASGERLFPHMCCSLHGAGASLSCLPCVSKRALTRVHPLFLACPATLTHTRRCLSLDYFSRAPTQQMRSQQRRCWAAYSACLCLRQMATCWCHCWHTPCTTHVCWAPSFCCELPRTAGCVNEL